MKIKSKKKGFSWEQWHWIALFLIVIDLIIISVSYFFALWIRFDCQYTTIPEYYRFAWLKFVPIYALATLIVMMCLRLYRSVWKYAGIVEQQKLMLASAILGVFHPVGITLLFQRMPRPHQRPFQALCLAENGRLNIYANSTPQEPRQS
jgi:FlaA1/EpsC-like NDP-sugar epimerase